MVLFTFHEGLPEELTFHVDPGIFHNPAHLALQAPAGWHTFYIRQANAVEGLMQFHVNDHRAVSPFRSPFGSFLFSNAVNSITLQEFIAYCESRLAEKAVVTLELKNQPERYSPERNHRLETALLSTGYSIAKEETSALISITEAPFELGLHRSEKKRLRKCRDEALTFEVMPLTRLQTIYTFLETCRAEKEYTLSMSFSELEKLAQAFPERLVLTAVSDKTRLVAANISILVYDAVLYNFYHDHSKAYDHLSPVVLLNEGLYKYCQQHHIRMLDLGTSNLAGGVNESLLNFKLRLGAQPSRKLTFTKRLV